MQIYKGTINQFLSIEINVQLYNLDEELLLILKYVHYLEYLLPIIKYKKISR
jgi:hypothetical protein